MPDAATPPAADGAPAVAPPQWPHELGGPPMLALIADAIATRRMPAVPLAGALENTTSIALADLPVADVETAVRLRCSMPSSSKERRAPTSLLDCLELTADGEVLVWCAAPPPPHHDDAAADTSPEALLQRAVMRSLPCDPPPFVFDASAHPAAKERVFTVRSDDFPDRDSWMAFCEANMKADHTLSTLNQTATQYQQSLARAAAAAAATATGGADADADVPSPADLHTASVTLAECVRCLPLPASGFERACPLTDAERAELCALCEAVASAASLDAVAPLPPAHARDGVPTRMAAGWAAGELRGVAAVCEAALASLMGSLVRFQSQQMHRWQARRSQRESHLVLSAAEHCVGCALMGELWSLHAEEMSAVEAEPPPSPNAEAVVAARWRRPPPRRRRRGGGGGG